ncbi:MAG: DUF1579 family protein, partial [Nitrospiraceae bacterium]
MRLVHLALASLCIVLTASIAMAKDKEAPPADPQAMMHKYQELATPGESHKHLASLAGSWTTKTTSWMEPDKPPMESMGTCEYKVLLDGRYV